MDNAYKYCRSKIRMSAKPRSSNGHPRPGLAIRVDDDGPGIAPEDFSTPEIGFFMKLLMEGMRRIDEGKPPKTN